LKRAPGVPEKERKLYPVGWLFHVWFAAAKDSFRSFNRPDHACNAKAPAGASRIALA
jgi:hypothetical protein